MRCDAFVEATGLFGEGTHFSLRVLCGKRIGPRRGAATGGKHLDKICASFHLGAHGATDLHLTVRLNTTKPQMSSRGGDARPRGDNTRAEHGTVLHGCPYGKGDAVQRATIAYGGDASA